MGDDVSFVCLLLLISTTCYEAVSIEKNRDTDDSAETMPQPIHLLKSVIGKLERLEVKIDSLDSRVLSLENKLDRVEQRLNKKLTAVRDSAKDRTEEVKDAVSTSEQRVVSLVESVKESLKDDKSSTEDELRNIQTHMYNSEQRQTGQLTSLVSQVEDKIKIHVKSCQNEAGKGFCNEEGTDKETQTVATGSPNKESYLVNLREELEYFSDVIVSNITDRLTRLTEESETEANERKTDELGRYFVSRGNVSEYHDIFNTGDADYRLAFRGTAHVGSSLYSAYKDGTGIPIRVENGCKSTDYSKPCSSHYRNNDVLNNWCDIDEVVFGIVDDGTLVKTIRFNGAGTTYMDWFQDKNLRDSSYVDLKTETKNFFSMEGDQKRGRRFFINRSYNGCPSDYGWVIAIEKDPVSCPWEKMTSPIPKLMYAEGRSYLHWASGSRSADAFVIFVKYRNS